MFSGSIDPIDLDIKAIIAEDLSPAARSNGLAAAARDALAEAEKIDAAAVGYTPTHRTVVDGRDGADEFSVMPNGTIEYGFNLMPDVFGWIYDQLVANSPVGSGRDPHIGLYRDSHALFADGVRVDDPHADVPLASEYVFVNLTEYARRVEEGQGTQASGVYEAVAALADLKFGDMAAIKFSYRAPFEGTIIAYVPLGRSRAKDHGDLSNKRGRFAASRVDASIRAIADIERNLRSPAITIRVR